VPRVELKLKQRSVSELGAIGQNCPGNASPAGRGAARRAEFARPKSPAAGLAHRAAQVEAIARVGVPRGEVEKSKNQRSRSNLAVATPALAFQGALLR